MRAGGAARHDANEEATKTAVAQAVQRMVAARLGKGFLPLGLVFLFGVLQMALQGPRESDYAILAVGSVAAAGAMLVYGNGAVRRALGTRETGLARATSIIGLIPYTFAFYLLGMRGLRPLSAGAGEPRGAVAVFVALGFVLLGVRILWDLTRLTRLHALARTMTASGPEEPA